MSNQTKRTLVNVGAAVVLVGGAALSAVASAGLTQRAERGWS